MREAPIKVQARQPGALRGFGVRTLTALVMGTALVAADLWGGMLGWGVVVSIVGKYGPIDGPSIGIGPRCMQGTRIGGGSSAESRASAASECEIGRTVPSSSRRRCRQCQIGRFFMGMRCGNGREICGRPVRRPIATPGPPTRREPGVVCIGPSPSQNDGRWIDVGRARRMSRFTPYHR